MAPELSEAHRVLDIEAQSILDAKSKLDDNFVRAVDLIINCQGKLIVTGIGKSGQIGRKISSTFSSTGTPSVFLHPAESSHGDLGVVTKGDVVLAISYGGESQELDSVFKYLARKDIPLIALTGKAESSLGKAAQISLDVSVKQEACPLGLAPTSSSTVTLAVGDALAMAVLKKKGFQKEDFAEFHPGGKLGRRLLLRVKDLMHDETALPLVEPSTDFKSLVSIMTQAEVRGVSGVVNESSELIGVVTDGDIRRAVEREKNPFSLTAEKLMSANPKTIDASELAEKALFVMEQFQIQTLFVQDKESAHPTRPLGLLHLQDLLRASIR